MISARVLKQYAAILALLIASWLCLSGTASETLDSGYIGQTRADAIVSTKDYTFKAFIVFGSAKTINSVISLAKSAETGGTLALSASIHPGEFLDPLDKLIERFSDLMLVIAVIGATMEIILVIGGAIGLQYLLAAGLVTIATASVIMSLAHRHNALRIAGFRLHVIGLGLCTLGILFSIGLPVAVNGTQAVFSHYLATTYQESSDKLRLTAEASKVDPGPVATTQPADTSWYEAIPNWFSDTYDNTAGFIGRISSYAYPQKIIESANDFFDLVVTLSMIFIMRALILPIAFLALIAWLVRSLVRVASPLLAPPPASNGLAQAALPAPRS